MGLLAFAALWAVVAWRLGHPGAAAHGALIVAGGYAGFMGLEFAVMWCVHGRDPLPRPTGREVLGAWFAEVTTSPRVFCWQQPFRAHAVPDQLSGTAPHGVLLVHGFVCNRGFWNAWMPALRARGIAFVAVSLEPAFGSLHEHVDRLDAAARELEAATGHPPVVVAHSMGGLAVRLWLSRRGGAERVRRVVTIGTPHRGTWTARFGTSTNAREMRPGSDLQQALATDEAPGTNAAFTCFHSHCDNIVYPPSTATLPGADNRHLRGMAHVHLVTHPEVFEEVVRWAEAPGPAAGRS